MSGIYTNRCHIWVRRIEKRALNQILDALVHKLLYIQVLANAFGTTLNNHQKFLALAALIVVDGLIGSPLAAKNMATVSAWVHYRGLVVLALLLVMETQMDTGLLL